ncbi:MAG: hypothetical protein IJL85_05130 [Erysipelotrichaceae bacterium]|nr:hypothetical protein [Erysipelotrichaceae bacterium]
MFRLKKNKKKHAVDFFKNKTVDYKRYIRDYYVENDFAYISCHVNSMEEILDRYSVPNYEDMNLRFISFIEDNAEHIPSEYPIVLKITGQAFSDEEQETIIESVQDYYNMKLGVVQEDLADNFRLSMMLLIGGIICLGIYLYFRDLITSNVILIIPTWFMFEEFINVFWLNRGEILEEQMNYAQLSSMKIIFQEHFVDDYISEESEEEIIKEIFDE